MNVVFALQAIEYQILEHTISFYGVSLSEKPTTYVDVFALSFLRVSASLR
jgi:hypothetical protein